MSAQQHQHHGPYYYMMDNSEAMASTRQQQFHDVCAMLRRNYPAVVQMMTPLWSGFFPIGYGRSYGEALLANSYISHIDLYISGLLPLDNTVSIETFTEPLLTYLRTSSSLRTVTWQCCYKEDRDNVFQLGCDILHAIAQNPAIETLEIETSLQTYHTQNRPTSQEPVYVSARKLPMSVTGAMADCIRSSTSKIQSLILASYFFDRNVMSELTMALEENGSIVSLSLLGCRIDREATNIFIVYMQYQNADTNIHTLRLRGCGGFFQGQPITFSMSIGNALSYIVQGSNIKRLILDDSREDNDTQSFCRALASTYALSQLEYLYLCQRTPVQALNELAFYLPLTHSLQELMIVDVDPTAQSARIVQALKENGTLHRVTMTYSDERNGSFFSDSVQRRVSAYCQRNIWTPKLLTQPHRENNTIYNYQTKASLEHSVHCTDLFHFPTLFRVAQQPTRMASTVVLTGLHGLRGTSIGPSRLSLTALPMHLHCQSVIAKTLVYD